jgi:hypothetical protein
MKQFAIELKKIIDQHYASLCSISSAEMEHKPSPAKWSKKELIGHLVDSAQNNIRRFIIAQYEENPHIVYQQDNWVRLSGYQQWNTKDLVDLWYLLNKQVCMILECMPPGGPARKCLTEELHTIEWLAADYIKHLNHHLHQVLELEPFPYS